MLLQSLRALCLAPEGSGSIWKYLVALVRSLRVSGRIACGLQTELHFADVHNSRVSYSEDSLHQHTIMPVIRLPSDSIVWCQQLAYIPQDRLSSSATTPSINISHKKQQSSYASAEGVVPTQKNPSGSIL